MLRFVLVVMLFGSGLTASGQTQPNPFDLKYRTHRTLPSPGSANPKPQPDSSGITAPVLLSNEVKPLEEVIKNAVDTPSFNIQKESPTSTEANNPFEMGAGGAKQDSSKVAANNPGGKAGTNVKIYSRISPNRRTAKGIQVFFILLSLLFLIFIVNVERNFVKDLWRVISNENYSSFHLRNQRNTMKQILLMMGYFIFIIQAGIFLYNLLAVFNVQGEILDNIWACFAFVLIIYLVRHGMISYLRWLFNNEKEMTLFGFDISIFNIMVGLVLLPMNVVLNFGPENLAKPLIIIGIIVIAVAYLMRQLRWMLTARQLISNSLFLFFVYLCAVEILPLWAISKIFW